jgi:pimeloyl-ACP methyl ester carboxylesterase
LSEPELQFLDVGAGVAARRIAFRLRSGTNPGLFWLPGFKSDMSSTKATALDRCCALQGRALVRFDYSGHGVSEGAFEAGTVSLWLEESLSVFRAATSGRQILVGSSMGGYIALLMARALARGNQTSPLAGLVLIAPATDFTEALMWKAASVEVREAIMRDGRWMRTSPYSDDAYPITRALIEDGRRNLLLDGLIRTHAPTRILQGMLDEEVPYAHAQSLVEHIAADPVSLSLIRDGDHRLSRPQDLAMLLRAIEELST